MITLDFSLHSNPRGLGFWEQNTSLLIEIDYVNQIKSVIQETQNEYKDDESVNPSLLWEMIKLKAREKSLLYSKIKKKQTKQRQAALEQTIARLEEEIDHRKNTDIYSSKSNSTKRKENDTVLRDDEGGACEGLLTEKEYLEALKYMESEKTSGTDGLPGEFYKVFWKDISSILISALNFAYESGQLSTTQKRGIIKLIPKKDADPSLIKN